MREETMAEKHKPQEDIVHKAATFMTHPEKATHEDVKRMAASLLDDQRNDPMKHAEKAKK
jgi:hypothetical protein